MSVRNEFLLPSLAFSSAYISISCYHTSAYLFFFFNQNLSYPASLIFFVHNFCFRSQCHEPLLALTSALSVSHVYRVLFCTTSVTEGSPFTFSYGIFLGISPAFAGNHVWPLRAQQIYRTSAGGHHSDLLSAVNPYQTLKASSFFAP